MRYRAALASMLAVMMLSLASVASACETRCDLMTFMPACHGGARQQPPASPDSMPGMDHSAPPAAAINLSPGAMLGATPACAHALCLQSPAILSATTSAKMADPAPSYAFLTVAVLAIEQVSHFAPVRGTPLHLKNSPVTLQTPLRV